jgi:hypothetical protein
MLPNSNITLANGNKGRLAPSQDGISGLILSGVAVVGQFALGDVLGPFTSVDDAVLKGITADYDLANTCMAHQQIKDFYDNAGNGTELYVMIVAATVTMTQMCDKTLPYAAKLTRDSGGRVTLIGITRVPDVTYVPTFSGQFEADLWTAVTNAQALAVSDFTAHRPINILIEGRNFQGTASSVRDLRSATETNANRVHIVMGADNDISNSAAYCNKYACVGVALGKAAFGLVNRSIGRVKSGPVLITNPGYSNGAGFKTLTEINRDSLDAKGYIFFRNFTRRAGYFFNGDHSACPITDDLFSLTRGRTIHKASRITYDIYVEEVLDEIEINPTTGKMQPSVIKLYQSRVEAAINEQMTSKGEISGCKAFVDPDQNIKLVGNVVTELSLVSKDPNPNINTTLSFAASV